MVGSAVTDRRSVHYESPWRDCIRHGVVSTWHSFARGVDGRHSTPGSCCRHSNRGKPSKPACETSGSCRPRSAGHWRSRSLRSEEHTSELQSLMRISYAVFCLKQKKHTQDITPVTHKAMRTKHVKSTI